jgi:hypothetical protein
VLAVPTQAVVLGVAILLGILFDQWFRTSWLGVAVPLYVVLVVGALLALSALARRPPTRRNLWCLAPLLLFALVPALHDAPQHVALDVLAVLGLLVLVAHAYADGALDRLGPFGHVVAAVDVMGGVIGRPFGAVASVGRAAGRRAPSGAQAGGRVLPVARGLLLAAPFLLVFTVLLASADVVFGAYVEKIAHIDLGWDLSALLEHGPIVLFVGWLVAGGLLHALRSAPTFPMPVTMARTPLADAAAAETGAPVADTAAVGPGAPVAGDAAARPDAPVADAAAAPPPAPLEGLPDPATLPVVTMLEAPWFRVGFGETATVLAAVDGLFGVFVVIQFAYLFGGRETLDVVGLTYAEYARRGFFELLAVAAIALPLVVGLDWLGRRDTPRQRRAFQALGGAMVLLTLVILGSAMLRMMLYEDAYGYTHLRLYSHAFMIWLAALCLLFLAALARERRQWLTFGVLVSLLVGLGGLNLLNPDRFIAEQNLRRYEAGRSLDARHLNDLSADATPVVLRALDLAAERDDATVRDALGRGLHQMLLRLDPAVAAPWPAANLARSRAYAALDARRAEIEAYPIGRSGGY